MNKHLFSSILFAVWIVFFTLPVLGGQTLKPSDPSRLSSGQPRITLNYRDVNIRDAFSSLAMEFKLNIVMSNEVQGTITLHVFNMTLEQSLSAIAMAGGYDYEKTGTLHRIYRATAEEKIKESAPSQIQMKIFKASFVEIDKVKQFLDAVPGLNPVEVHETSKTIIVNDTPENIQKIEKIFCFLDSVPKQVLIEAQILKVSLDDSMSFGVDWKSVFHDGALQTNGLSNALLPGGASPVPPQAGSGLFGNFIAGITDTSSIAVAIDMLKEKTDVDTISTPKVLAIHGREAKVVVGGQQGYRITTVNNGVSTETIEFIDTGTILEITPYIDDQNNILLNVKPAITSVKIEAGIPVTDSTTVSTWLLSKDGETVFIAGLIETLDIKTKEGVPLLMEIPVLGNLFSRTKNTTGKKELVIMITPRIIRNGVSPPPQ